jgi:hypothetical protein
MRPRNGPFDETRSGTATSTESERTSTQERVDELWSDHTLRREKGMHDDTGRFIWTSNPWGEIGAGMWLTDYAQIS